MMDLTDSKVDIESSSVRFAHSDPIILAMNNLRFSLEPPCLVAYCMGQFWCIWKTLSVWLMLHDTYIVTCTANNGYITATLAQATIVFT